MSHRVRLVTLACLATVAFVFAVPRFVARLHADSTSQSPIRVRIEHGTQPTYAFAAGVDGEIFPSMANYASLQRPRDRDFGTFTVTVTNSSDTVLNARIQVQVPGWSDVELRSISVGAGEVRELFFGPVFFPRFYTNHEIIAATAVLKVSDSANNLLHSEVMSVRLRSTEDMYWGRDFKFAPFIASWVTPHDPRVEAVLSKAKEFMPGRRLPGYEEWKSPDQQRIATMAQAKAIYRAVHDSGVSYVKSSLTFGRNTNISERVRLPGGSLQHLSANCIDGVVLYASLFENLGLDPVIVLVPGHAYIAVRDADGSSSLIYFETAVTGRLPFEAAVHIADKGVQKFSPSDVIRIPVSQARSSGIFPMPVPGEDTRHFPSTDPSANAAPPGR